MPQTAVLAHHQPDWARAGTFIPKEVAEELVQRMAAEKISARVIRMMAPGSIFLPAVKAAIPSVKYVPTSLPPAEVGNCRFVPPITCQKPSASMLRADWDWTKEADYLPKAVCA